MNLFSVLRMRKQYLNTLEKNEELQIKVKNLQADIDIERRKLESEYKIKLDNLKNDFEQKEKRMKIENESVMASEKLNLQQQTASAILAEQRKTIEVEKKYSQELSELRAKTAEEQYGKLTVAMDDLHTKGNVTTKLVHDMAIKMLEKVPADKRTLQIEHVDVEG